MKNLVKSLSCAMLCGAFVTTGAAPILAQPGVASPFAIAGSSQGVVELAQYRNVRRYAGYRRGRGYGNGIGLGIGVAAIIGGIVLSEAARAEHRSAHGNAWDRCAQTYRSFEPETGMYTLYDGSRRTCPFLH